MNNFEKVRADIIGGVDTHKDSHTAAAVDGTGKLRGIETFPATAVGYAALLDWLNEHGNLTCVGVEGTGSYGSGLAAFLRDQSVPCREVIRPNRQARRRRGKSDPADAEAAARATLAGEANGIPKAQDGAVEAIRILRLERRSAIRARTQAANQMHAVVLTSPEPLRDTLRALSISKLVDRACKRRKADATDAASATHRVLKGLARRWQQLDKEITGLDTELGRLVRQRSPELLAMRGVGVEVAGALLVAVGDNPERLKSEASFAAMCGVCPVDASSGRQHRHRLNRGGNRDANRALWVAAFVRLTCDPRTKTYVERRTSEGLSKPEILRCLKRFIAREVFKVLRGPARERPPQNPGAIAA